MWKLGAGAALAMTTMMGSTAWGQVLTNGGFETGDLSGWTCTGGDMCQPWAGSGQTGTFALQGFDNTGFATLSQSFATVAGARYQLSFAQRVSNLVNVVRYSMGGGAPVDVTESTNWSTVIDEFVATGTTSAISLYFETDSGTGVVLFDDIAVILLGPGIAEEISALVAAAGGAARLVVLEAKGVARDMGKVSLVTRDGQTGLAQVAPAGDGPGTGLVGNIYSWAQITGFDSTADTGPGSISGAGFQIGADVAVGANMVAGLSLGRTDIQSTDGTTSQEGTLTFLQPYLSYRSGNWNGDASLIFGRGSYDQTSLGGDGTGETKLFALTYEGGYDFALQDSLTLTPLVGLVYGRETVEGTGGTLAASGSDKVDFAQTSLGARLTRQMQAGQVFGGVYADYLEQDSGAVLSGNFLSEDGWSGRIELGGSTETATGLGISTSVDVSGIGGSAQTLSGGLRVAFTF